MFSAAMRFVIRQINIIFKINEDNTGYSTDQTSCNALIHLFTFIYIFTYYLHPMVYKTY